MTALVLARWDARASLRDRWFLTLAAAFGVLTLAAAATSLAGLKVIGLSSFDRAAAALVSLAQLFIPLLGLTLGAVWLAGDRETGALAFLLAQPVSRGTLYAGRYVGVGAPVLGAVWLGYGAAGVVMAWGAGTDRLGLFLTLVGLSSLLALAMLSVGFLISAFAPTRGRALGASLFAWLGFVVLGDLGVLTAAVGLRLPALGLLLLAAMNPVCAFRMASLLGIPHSPELLGPLGLLAVDRFGQLGAALALVGVLLAWTLGAFVAGFLRFTRMPQP
ncbi:MAG: ABC transporter permease subunit [Armatimonadota bacterium]|nr:ABC transporter permease subunit [Armatimonadota bacterium]MDR7570550.1 ABC transporter permease subunit [Armatimonadota bacterium]MDR7615100.1 ABC transporter permease subunit [Armatimonadota bacterium]